MNSEKWPDVVYGWPLIVFYLCLTESIEQTERQVPWPVSAANSQLAYVAKSPHEGFKETAALGKKSLRTRMVYVKIPLRRQEIYISD